MEELYPSWQDRLRSWWNWNYWQHSERTWQDKLRWYFRRFLGFWASGVRQLGLLSFILGVLGVRPMNWGLPYDLVWTQFYHMIVPELLAIGVTVLLVDYANERRADRDLKAQLIRQLGSKHTEVAATALEELRAHNWLFDGSLYGANLKEASLPGARLREANLQGVYLKEADLQGANLQLTNLEDAYLEEANLQGANFSSANLQGANLARANLQQTYLFDANLQGAFLSYANLRGADLSYINLQDADLPYVNLQDVRLFEANLQGALLQNANLQGAYLEGALLQNAYLGEANLQNAYLGEANLHGAILRRANLQGAEKLTSMQLMQAHQLAGAITPNGDCYMGQFDLPGEKEDPNFQYPRDMDDANTLAAWYREQCEHARAYHRKWGWLRSDDDSDDD